MTTTCPRSAFGLATPTPPAGLRVCALAALLLCAAPHLAAQEGGKPASPQVEPAALEPVVISGTRRPEVAGQRSVSAQELRSVPGALGDPLKSLQSLPGVVANSDASSDPAVRGSRPEDNRYLIDGLPVGNVFHLGGLTSVLNPSLVSRFDLYSAAFGPEYGNATGAVVDVRLRRPRSDRIGGTLDVSALGADVLLEGPLGEGKSFYLAAKRSWLDLLVKQVSDGSDPSSGGAVVQMPRYHDHLGKFFWRLNADHELQLQSSGASDRLDLEIPAGSALSQQEPVFTGQGRFSGRDHTEAATLESRFGEAAARNRLSIGRLTTRADNRIGSALSLQVTQRDHFLINQLQLPDWGAHRVSLGGELHQVSSDYAVNARNALCTEFEADCNYSGADAVAATDSLSVRATLLHVKDRWQFAPGWAATVGLHHSRDSYLKRRDTEPRLGLEWQWSEHTLLSAAWGRHNQIPPPQQIVPELGNPRLDHLHARHLGLGIAQTLSAGWSWRAELYQKRLRDLVVGDATQNYVNGGSGRAHGLELLLRRDEQPGVPWWGWVSLSWSQASRRNELTGETFRFEYDQPLVLHAVGQWRLGHGWQVGAKWSFHSGAPYTEVVGTTTQPDGRIRPDYGPLNGSRLPAYHRLDLRAEKQVTRDFFLYAELINAYRRRNLDGYAYSADYQTRTPVEQLGLLPSVGVKVNF
jgi:hypothetical protein